MSAGYPVHNGLCYEFLHDFEIVDYITNHKVVGFEKDYFVIKKNDGETIRQRVPYDIDILRSLVDSNIIAYCKYAKALSCESYSGDPIDERTLTKIDILLSGHDSCSMNSLYRNRKRAKRRFEAIQTSLSQLPTHFRLNQYDAAGMLNYFFQWIGTRPNHTSDIHNIRHHGVPTNFWGNYDDEEKRAMNIEFPTFCFQDYVRHEMLTGVSLSIEISAALLEFNSFKLRKKAWKMFCSDKYVDDQSMLSWVVCSNELCSRAALARMYLLSIRDRYDCSQFSNDPIELDMSLILRDSFRPTINRLSSVIPYRLSTKNFKEKVANTREEIACKIDYAQKVLSAIMEPFHFDQLFQARSFQELRPDDGHITLAVFCNPQHRFVKEYIENNIKKQRAFERYEDEFASVYGMVHSAVLKEITRQRRDGMLIRIDRQQGMMIVESYERKNSIDEHEFDVEHSEKV